MLKKVFLSSLILILSLSLLTGCGTTTPTPTSQPSTNTPAQTSYPFSFKDDAGTNVTVTAAPQRIISIVPSATETLYALGLGSKVIAVTQWDNYPADVQKNKEYIFPDALKPNAEQILKLNPDLIILGMSDPATISAIRNLKIPVMVVNPETLAATYQSIDTFGQITNVQAESNKLVTSMKTKEQSIEAKVATISTADRLRVWTEVDPTLYTPGAGTFLNELITKAGGINIAQDVKGWGQFNSEQVISKNPQVIFETYGYYQKNAISQITARPGWQTIDAVKNKRVLELDSDLVTRPGPRIVDGMESIAKALYPDLFK